MTILTKLALGLATSCGLTDGLSLTGSSLSFLAKPAAGVIPGKSKKAKKVQPVVDALPRKRVHYLFMLYDHVKNAETWKSFFEVAPHAGMYSILIHCKDQLRCDSGGLPGAEIITSVPSSYCFDLVTPMVALTRRALMNAGEHDVFVFVSDSTIPMKPIEWVHQALLGQDGGLQQSAVVINQPESKKTVAMPETDDTTSDTSNICFFPAVWWARRPMSSPTDGYEVSAKHHQWVTLSYRGASTFARNYNQDDIRYQTFMNSWGLQNNGCIDEYYFTHILFGSIGNVAGSDFNHERMMLKFQALAEQRKSEGEDAGYVDDRCWSAAFWSQPDLQKVPALQRYMQEKGLLMWGEGAQRPASVEQLTIDALKEMRKSPFLFLRKVVNVPRVVDSCETFDEAASRILLTDVVQPSVQSAGVVDLEYLTNEFKQQFQGKWVDVAKGDTTIHCQQGRKPRELVLNARSSSKDTFIWGGYALICGRRVSLQFYDQILEGKLDKTSNMIYWANGAQWKKTEGVNAPVVQQVHTPEEQMATPEQSIGNLPGAVPLNLNADENNVVGQEKDVVPFNYARDPASDKDIVLSDSIFQSKMNQNPEKQEEIKKQENEETAKVRKAREEKYAKNELVMDAKTLFAEMGLFPSKSNSTADVEDILMPISSSLPIASRPAY